MTIVTESAPIEIEEEGVEFTSELFDCNQEEHSPAKVFLFQFVVYFSLIRPIQLNVTHGNKNTLAGECSS